MKNETKELTIQENAIPEKIAVVDDSEFSLYLDTARFDHLWRISSLFAKSDLVPDQYRGKPENCMISIAMAVRLGVEPMMMLQNSYIVHGKPGIEAKMAIALINASDTFTGPVQYKYEGEGVERSCTAFATSKANGEICGQTVDIKMAKAEGWYDKKGSKWKTLPDLMLAYRSAMFLARLYCPEVLMGLQTTEELHDVGEIQIIDNQKSESEGSKSVADRFKKQPEEESNDQKPYEPQENSPSQKLAEMVEDPQYKTAINSLLSSGELDQGDFSTSNDGNAELVVESILKVQGFQSAEISSNPPKTEEEYF